MVARGIPGLEQRCGLRGRKPRGQNQRLHGKRRSNRGQAYAKNVGWRIDYQIATPGIAAEAKRTSIFKDIKFSDHAPLIVEYDYKVKS